MPNFGGAHLTQNVGLGHIHIWTVIVISCFYNHLQNHLSTLKQKVVPNLFQVSRPTSLSVAIAKIFDDLDANRELIDNVNSVELLFCRVTAAYEPQCLRSSARPIRTAISERTMSTVGSTELNITGPGQNMKVAMSQIGGILPKVVLSCCSVIP